MIRSTTIHPRIPAPAGAGTRRSDPWGAPDPGSLTAGSGASSEQSTTSSTASAVASGEPTTGSSSVPSPQPDTMPTTPGAAGKDA